MFTLRIVNVDHYMTSPKFGLDLTYSQFRGAQIKSVPVLRIFGSTLSGSKTCLHVHGVFPYVLVPHGGDDPGRLMYQLASSLDKAINVSLGMSSSNRQHVFKVALVSGRPFYGYHSQDHQFFKIFFYNPLIVKRACDLLQNGAICGTKFQIHEGHVPFTLQFFIDYNLYGMSFINLKSVVFRKDASPPGVACGSLPKETYCELEADAVAIDILNRLMIEGELAVNPGLAAIWGEEQERLGRDRLEVSQRPKPPPAMSELLLRDKLRDNLKFQGKCNTPMKENIPYPTETQGTRNGVLDASVLDTHSVSTLATTRLNSVEEEAVVDEQLILSLTQDSILSTSLDQSLIAALDHLAAQHELNTAMSQAVEDDSILSSQNIPQQDLFDQDISDEELEALNFSLPPDLHSDNDYEDENNEESDGNIPQLDGVGDVRSNKKKAKRSKRRVLVENSVTEIGTASDGEEILLNNIKDNDFWPETGKQESLEEIFTNDESYNSSLNNFKDRPSANLEDDNDINIEINLDLVSNFDTVLRGDPSFSSEQLVSEDVIFQPKEKGEPIWNGIDAEERNRSFNEDIQETQNNFSSNGLKKPIADKNSNIDVMISMNNSVETSELATCGEELLNTSQLDEIFNEDLNKGLDIIYEKSPPREFDETIVRSEKHSRVLEFIKDEEDTLSNDEDVETNGEGSLGNKFSGSVQATYSPTEGKNETHGSEEQLILYETKNEDVKIKEFLNNIPQAIQTDAKDNFKNRLLSELTTPEVNTLNKNLKKVKSSPSPKKKLRGKLKVNFFNKKKIVPKQYRPPKKEEIDTYFSLLENVSKYLSTRSGMQHLEPIIWSSQSKTSIEKIIKNCNFTSDEKSKLTSCFVKLCKLEEDNIRQWCYTLKGMGNLNNSCSEEKGNLSINVKEKNNNLKIKSLDLNNPLILSESPVPLTQLKSKITQKQQENCETIVAITSKCDNASSPKVPVVKLEMLKPVSEQMKIDKSFNTIILSQGETVTTSDGLKCDKHVDVRHIYNSSKITTKENIKRPVKPAIETLKLSESDNLSRTCVLKLSPLSINIADKKNICNVTLPSAIQRIEKKRNSRKKTRKRLLVAQKNSQGKILVQKVSKEIVNACSLVRLENKIDMSKAKSSQIMGQAMVDDELMSTVKPSKKISPSLILATSQNLPLFEDQTSRKRPMRMYSLDGTVDNSSSDENLDDKAATKKSKEKIDHCRTPNKRRKSKSCHSPRNYVPLSIEIKKSPKNEPKEPVKNVVEEKLPSEDSNKTMAKDSIHKSASNEELCIKKMCLEPFVLVQRLPSSTNDGPSILPSPHHVTKRLKVSVRRLSLDELDDPLMPCRVDQLRARSHRSSSLPITTQ